MKKTKTTGVKRHSNPQNVLDLTALLVAFGPSHRCLAQATANYTTALKVRPRTAEPIRTFKLKRVVRAKHSFTAVPSAE